MSEKVTAEDYKFAFLERIDGRKGVFVGGNFENNDIGPTPISNLRPAVEIQLEDLPLYVIPYEHLVDFKYSFGEGGSGWGKTEITFFDQNVVLFESILRYVYHLNTIPTLKVRFGWYNINPHVGNTEPFFAYPGYLYFGIIKTDYSYDRGGITISFEAIIRDVDVITAHDLTEQNTQPRDIAAIIEASSGQLRGITGGDKVAAILALYIAEVFRAASSPAGADVTNPRLIPSASEGDTFSAIAVTQGKPIKVSVSSNIQWNESQLIEKLKTQSYSSSTNLYQMLNQFCNQLVGQGEDAPKYTIEATGDDTSPEENDEAGGTQGTLKAPLVFYFYTESSEATSKYAVNEAMFASETFTTEKTGNDYKGAFSVLSYPSINSSVISASFKTNNALLFFKGNREVYVDRDGVQREIRGRTSGQKMGPYVIPADSGHYKSNEISIQNLNYNTSQLPTANESSPNVQAERNKTFATATVTILGEPYMVKPSHYLFNIIGLQINHTSARYFLNQNSWDEGISWMNYDTMTKLKLDNSSSDIVSPWSQKYFIKSVQHHIGSGAGFTTTLELFFYVGPEFPTETEGPAAPSQ